MWKILSKVQRQHVSNLDLAHYTLLCSWCGCPRNNHAKNLPISIFHMDTGSQGMRIHPGPSNGFTTNPKFGLNQMLILESNYFYCLRCFEMLVFSDLPNIWSQAFTYIAATESDAHIHTHPIHNHADHSGPTELAGCAFRWRLEYPALIQDCWMLPTFSCSMVRAWWEGNEQNY